MRRWAGPVHVALVFALVVALGACSAPGSRRGGTVDPAFVDTLIASHNARASGFPTLWARVSVRIRGLDSEGDRFEEQGEGWLQYEAPDRVSLSVGKLGETYFAYGSDGERYWTFDLAGEGPRRGLTGELLLVTRRKSLAIGLGVHPSDLVEAMGVSPIDPTRVTGSERVGDDRVVVSVRSRWGVTDFFFDTARELPVEVVIRGEEGEEIARASLAQYKPLLEPNGLETELRVPGIVEITTPGDSDGYLRLGVSSPTRKAIRGVVFDEGRLRRAYRVEEIIDLDTDVDWDAAP